MLNSPQGDLRLQKSVNITNMRNHGLHPLCSASDILRELVEIWVGLNRLLLHRTIQNIPNHLLIHDMHCLRFISKHSSAPLFFVWQSESKAIPCPVLC